MNKSNKNHVIGVDIGGTKMSAVLFDGEKVLADYIKAGSLSRGERLVKYNRLMEIEECLK